MRIPVRQLAVLACVVFALVTGCARPVPGRASAAPATGTAAIAAPPVTDLSDVTTALQRFWRQAFPAAFGTPWRDIRRFVPVHTASRGAATPPCVERAADLDGQAFYCPAADAVVWDADGLLPQIRREFGTAGVVVVLAHEVGHAVQTRLGVDGAQARDPAAYPTILLEAMSDCYAGATVAHLPLDVGRRDTAMLALVGFRDPVGIGPSDASAHGNAFDRVSAFQDGWTGGPTLCAAMTVAGRSFTERRFGSAADQARGGNLPLSRLLPAVETDARQWFTALAAQNAPGQKAPGWRAPALRTSPGGACSGPGLTDQGPARFCPADGSIDVDLPGLTAVEDRGDYAAATLVASRYALAFLTATGRPATGPAAVCLAGAYTARLLDPSGSFTLSPGDLDEAVQVLLAADWAARSPQGTVDGSEDGFDRVTRFRQGVRHGAASCLP